MFTRPGEGVKDIRLTRSAEMLDDGYTPHNYDSRGAPSFARTRYGRALSRCRIIGDEQLIII